MVKLPYKKFTEITEIELSGCSDVEVSLGCAEFALRDIKSAGFPVFLSLRTPDGKYLGNGAYAGAVTAFDMETLEKIWSEGGEALSEDEVYLSAGCNAGGFLDEEGLAICSECLSAAGEWNDPDDSVYDKESEDFDPDANAATVLNPEAGCVCWSCAQMFNESLNDRIFGDFE
jgi:hypothetical protein